MRVLINIPVCRQVRSLRGFYALINGQRLHFKRRADAIAAVQAVLDMQRLQVVTVDQFAARNATRIGRQMRIAQDKAVDGDKRIR